MLSMNEYDQKLTETKLSVELQQKLYNEYISACKYREWYGSETTANYLAGVEMMLYILGLKHKFEYLRKQGIKIVLR